MEYPESGSSHLDSKMLDSGMLVASEEDPYVSALRRARDDDDFRFTMLSTILTGDATRISTLFGLDKDDPRLSTYLGNGNDDTRLSNKPKPRDGKQDTKKHYPSYVVRGPDDALIAKMRREGRKKNAESFRREYSYGSSMEQKTFVWPGGTYPWTDKSSGITWVGVHGMNSICVVTRAGDLDVTRVHRYLKYHTVETVLRKFRKTAISEIEDLASPSSKLCESFGQSNLKPFGVVSVALGSDNAHEESGHKASSDEDEEDKEGEEDDETSSDENDSIDKKRERIKKYLLKRQKIRRKNRQHCLPTVAGYDEKKTIKFLKEQMRKDTTLTVNETVKASSTEYHESKAIKFLLEKMKMNIEAFTVDETIKTAISAFHHLFQKKFKANEIEVSVMDPNYFVKNEEADYKDIYVKHLEMSDVEDHLAAINEPGSGGSLK